MKIEINCAMCGKDKEINLKENEVDSNKSLKRIIEDEAGWITQQNDINFDIYCSKHCAS